jgi:hypothetical protein
VYGAHNIFDSDLGFDQVTVGAELFATLALVVARKCGHHNNFYIACFGGRTQNIEHVEPADLGHHHVTNDQVGPVFDCHCQCFFAVACRNDIVSFGQKSYAIDFA